MKPFMNQTVTVYVPFGEPDKNGRRKFQPFQSQARVQFSSKTIRNQDGTVYQTILDIDLPTETPVSYGTEISYTDNGVTTKGKVVLLEDILNLTGTHVDYRNVNVG